MRKRFPCSSDLRDCVRQFRAFYADKDVFEPRNCKLIDANKLRSEDRWDIDRFWSDVEKKELGLIEAKAAITLAEFESIVDSLFTSIKEEINDLKEETW